MHRLDMVNALPAQDDPRDVEPTVRAPGQRDDTTSILVVEVGATVPDHALCRATCPAHRARGDVRRQGMAKKTTAAPNATCPTGLAGLDDITGGGQPRRRPRLVCGLARCGKIVVEVGFPVRGAMALDDGILTAPTFVKRLPLPLLRRLIAGLSNDEHALVGLGLKRFRRNPKA